MIALHNVTKTLDQVRAVSDVSFAVPRGEAMALIGPSGSGKTTLLRLIAGLEEPDAGKIELDGCTASRPGMIKPPHTRGIGMVFQRPALWPHLTVAQNVAFGLARWRGAEAKERTREVLHQVELAGKERRLPHQLSGGEAQRVALARALAPRPQILLLDEPLSNLDAELHAGMIELVRRMQLDADATMIFVSHDPSAAAKLCSRVVVLGRGKVLQAGSWDRIELRSFPRMVELQRTSTASGLAAQ